MIQRYVAILALLPLMGNAYAAGSSPQARQLAQDAVIVDTHIDAPTELVAEWQDLGALTPSREFDYPRAREGGLDVAFMSIYTSPDEDRLGTARQIATARRSAMQAPA